MNFLLGCSDSELDAYELARLAAMADLRAQLHELYDKLIEQQALAGLVRWFRAQDRQTLKYAIENAESPMEWAKRMIREGQRSEEELIPRPSLPPGAAHLAAAVRYQEGSIADGNCSVCPEPLDPNSVRYCTKHMTAERTRSARRRGVKGEPGSADYLYGEITESLHGRTPGTLASLAMHREKATRALCAETGIPFESAAVSLKAAIEALLNTIPQSKADAMTQTELFEKAGVITKTTGQRALNELLAKGKIQRTGKGGPRDLYRYFRL